MVFRVHIFHAWKVLELAASERSKNRKCGRQSKWFFTSVINAVVFDQM